MTSTLDDARELLALAERCAKYDLDTIEMIECKWQLWDDILEALRAAPVPRCDAESAEGLTDCAEHMLLQARPAEGGDWINIYAAQLQGLARSGGYDFRALVSPPSEAGREECDRTETIINRSVNCHWITVLDREQFKATLRIALDTEVEAGGPYLNNGWNKRALSPDQRTVAVTSTHQPGEA